MSDLSLGGVAHARSTDPQTSHDAASKVDVNGKQSLTLRAMFELRGVVPLPVEAWRVSGMAARIQRRDNPNARPLGGSTIRTRLNEMARLDPPLVEVVDRDGLTESGGRCARYRLTASGLAAARKLKEKEAAE
ncbi:hypothetical protein [Bifidobacterium panos]|uniref:Uncharacterized protein n=1 Tax=Bifidobacterium panos TaxID=2675321 RepID=A0ABX1SY81_9BIFI|nr:hypothetical protein [Bifidobacterium sp. DSM 109963]NMN02811.1 hypothetical protein [Bifidobacterium sp. DSM 109963]